MAHGERAEKNGRPGYEWGSRRLYGMPSPGPYTKLITHRRERQEGHAEEREAVFLYGMRVIEDSSLSPGTVVIVDPISRRELGRIENV